MINNSEKFLKNQELNKNWNKIKTEFWWEIIYSTN